MIELRNVSKTVISGTEPLTIVKPLDLSVAAGEYLSIVGPSGSGKATFIQRSKTIRYFHQFFQILTNTDNRRTIRRQIKQ